MKKVLFTALTLIGLSMGTASAQNCCATEKEECKPTVCCPTTPECCEEGEESTATIQKPKRNKREVAKAKNGNSRIFVRRETLATNK